MYMGRIRYWGYLTRKQYVTDAGTGISAVAREIIDTGLW